MGFTVESGAGLSTANSYVSVTDADDYHTLRQNTDWSSFTTEEKQAALVYATAYIDSKFDWPGYVKETTQALDWPRLSAQDNEHRIMTGIPNKLKDAVCELALVHYTEQKLNQTFDRGGAIKSEQVGSVSVEYFSGAAAGNTYPFLESILSSLIVSGSSSVIQLIRG